MAPRLPKERCLKNRRYVGNELSPGCWEMLGE
jgi:hypothetical protein